jgi:prenyltransferase beta subunit
MGGWKLWIAAAGCLLVAMLLALPPQAGAQDMPKLHKEVSAATVNDAIRMGVGYLHSKQQANGSWSDFESPFAQPGAITALMTLALLNCGERVDEPHVAKALEFLEKQNPPGSTYSTSLHVMAFCQADPQRYKLKISGLAKWLEANQVKDGSTKGGWSYTPAVGIGDNSNTQFAMLALHEAERVGVKISDQTWVLAKDYWIKNPVYDKGRGAFGYHNGVSGSMTCAAIASLIIARDRLSNGEARVVGEMVQCCGNEPAEDEVERAIDWLGRNFTVRNNPGDDGQAHRWLLYYLYGMERVGRMSGQRFFYGKPQMNPNTGQFTTPRYDWYREGCEVLLSQQDSFEKKWSGTELERDPLIATPLALLFLAKGRRPVVIARLQTPGVGNDWNHHRRSLQNLVGRVERQWRRDLSWQTYDFKDATVVDLLESPVLFLSGTQALQFTDAQRKTLREYVNQGGFLFIEACDGNGCNGSAFDQSVRQMLKEMFPESDLRKLPPEHAVWYAQQKVLPQHLPPDPEFWLWGLDSCCRTGVVYCPRSLSCYWELAHPYRESDYPQKVKDQIEQVSRIGGNVLAYATNRQLKEKLDKPQVALGPINTKSPRGALLIPKLSHGGGSDDAPNALMNLLTVMDKQFQMKVDYQRRPPFAANEPKLLDYPLVFAHGRQAFQFSAVERRALKEYLDRGGFLFADAICASEEFANSLRTELLAIYPNAKFTRLPPGHPMLTEDFHGFNLSSVMLRDPKFRSDDDPLAAKLTKTTPFLEVLEVDERIAVVLSPYDLSCALEKGASLECKGYIPADAARIGANVILYALQQ